MGMFREASKSAFLGFRLSETAFPFLHRRGRPAVFDGSPKIQESFHILSQSIMHRSAVTMSTPRLPDFSARLKVYLALDDLPIV